jgi:8-oxo-dGTP pyrophosphatase MutT (NUDIX family)
VTEPARRGGQQIIPRPSVWSHGPAAPWPDAPPALTLEVVLAAVPPSQPPGIPTFPSAKASAVLVVLADGDRGPEVLLTRRSWELRTHRGEISFPGGRIDPGETPDETALREAWEEVGLEPAVVTIHGELEHLSTVASMSHIVPKVASVAAKPVLAARTMEVERVLWVPLAELTAPGVYRAERWGGHPVDRVLHFFELDDETIWGATALMLFDLLTRVLAPGARA